MKEKLSAYLDDRKEEGFTLVELLVVIAIIAILVLLVIVAINPLERIRDANDRNAQNTARQLGSAVASCITKELSNPGGDWAAASATCSDFATLAPDYIADATAYTTAGVTLSVSVGTENICITVPNGGGHPAIDPVNFNSLDSSISSETTPVACL